MHIHGYGDVDILMQTALGGSHILRLKNVAYVPDFATNVASVRRLRDEGIFWDNQLELLRRADGTALGMILDLHDQYVLEHPGDLDRAAFFTRRNRFNSWTERRPRLAEADIWHLRLGHPGPEALEHLVNSTKGVRIRGPATKECDSCARGKMTRQEYRKPKDLSPYRTGERLALDFHDFEPDDEGFKTLLLVVDRESGSMWDYYLKQTTTETVILALHDLIGILDQQHEVKVKVVESDQEIIQKLPGVKRYLERRHIRTEPSPGDTQALNGGAERNWRSVKEHIIAMRDGAKLPVALWREVSRAAVFLLNRTPRQRLGWKTPHERFHSKGGIIRKPDISNLRVYGCKAYVMTVTAMRKEERLKRFNPKCWIGYLVGYTSSNTFRIWNPIKNTVVVMREVIFNEQETFSGKLEDLRDDIREVDLDELSTLLKEYALPDPQSDLQTNPSLAPRGVEELLDLDDEEEVLDTIVVATNAPDVEETAAEATNASDVEMTGATNAPEKTNCERIVPAHAQEPEETGALANSAYEESLAAGALKSVGEKPSKQSSAGLPTPPPTPPAALLAAVLTGSANPLDSGAPGPGGTLGIAGEALTPGTVAVQHGAFQADAAHGSSTAQARRSSARMTPADCWKGAFYAGMRATVVKTEQGNRLTKAVFERRLGSGEKLHRKELPKPPEKHADLEEHPLGELFKLAEKDHLQEHEKMGSWTEILLRDPRARGHKILGCRWVYIYKFDKHGRFLKAKARLVVRGDQQIRDAHANTYAATLAGRSFRAIMAIAARFDLELLQFDAVNAFVNANLDEEVFMRMPPGHTRAGWILRLNKALYGLRRSPLLWQQELTQALKKLGFRQVPHEPCAYTRNGIVIFFYVDDIVVMFKDGRRAEALEAINQLKQRYRLTGGDELQWFLGIEIIRDRPNRLLWLSQSQYLLKIAGLAQSTPSAHSPMGKAELMPFEGTATAQEIAVYQRKIGSLLYAAVITRPDVAFATSRLARFIMNPGPEHQKAADRVLRYLGESSSYALQLGGGDDLCVASDASFADNTLDRKSSQGYAIKLFGGLIAWRANKQDTVTTSTTEAELLALSQAAKEGMFMERLLKELGVEFDTPRITIECDNTQTIRLVTEEIARLKTSLRHVDIHNHWLRQEHARGKISVVYTESAKMMADGLTKALVQAAYESFREKMGLVDVEKQIVERRRQEDLALARKEDDEAKKKRRRGGRHNQKRGGNAGKEGKDAGKEGENAGTACP